MLGAPAGDFGVGGHHGLEPATVLSILPPNVGSLPALIALLPIDAAAVSPGSLRSVRHTRDHACSKTIIRIMTMVSWPGVARPNVVPSGKSGLSRRRTVAAEAQPRDDRRAVRGRPRDAAQPQSRRTLDRSPVRRGRRDGRRLLQPVREQGGLLQRADRTRRPRRRTRTVADRI